MANVKIYSGKTDAAGSGKTGFAMFFTALAAVLLANGCAVLGPDYERPAVRIESNWMYAQDTLATEEAPPDPNWWKTAFQDPELDRLVEEALDQNLTLRSAALRVLQSQQRLAIAVGNQFPQQQQASGTASRQKSEGTTFDAYQIGFNLAWEIDFWGRFRRLTESASAELGASVAGYDEVLVLLVTQTARTYILVRTFQKRLEAAQTNILLQKESLRIAQAKFDAGEVSELDVNQAESLLNNTIATSYALEASLLQLKNSLAILLGKVPGELDYLPGEKGDIPKPEREIALGMPQDLIRRRPDIRIAERQLAAQSAQIGFAVTELYPHFAIGGLIGTAALRTGDLFENDSETWDLFGAFQWNLFNYGRLESNVRLQDSFFQQLLTDYLNTVLTAQAEVENAIVAYIKSYQQLKAYELAAEASRRAVDISETQHQDGLVDFNTVISVLRTHVLQQDTLFSTMGNVASNLVQVYQALGGGWEIRENRDPVDFLPSDVKNEMRERTPAWKGVLH